MPPRHRLRWMLCADETQALSRHRTHAGVNQSVAEHCLFVTHPAMRAVAPVPPSSIGIRCNRTSSKPAWASARRSTTLRQFATSSQQDQAQEPQQQQQQQQKERQRADLREERHTSPTPSANHSPSPLARPAPNTQPGMPVQRGLPPKLALLAAAMLWGSYSVSVRLIFSTEQPPDAVVVLALRGLLQAAAMLAFSSTLQQDERSTDATHVHHKDTPQLTTDAQQPKQQQPVLQRQGGNLLRQWLTLESPPLWMAALELGLWNFSATSLQVCTGCGRVGSSCNLRSLPPLVTCPVSALAKHL